MIEQLELPLSYDLPTGAEIVEFPGTERFPHPSTMAAEDFTRFLRSIDDARVCHEDAYLLDEDAAAYNARAG